jgi:hypothetical protein
LFFMSQGGFDPASGEDALVVAARVAAGAQVLVENVLSEAKVSAAAMGPTTSPGEGAVLLRADVVEAYVLSVVGVW